MKTLRKTYTLLAVTACLTLFFGCTQAKTTPAPTGEGGAGTASPAPTVASTPVPDPNWEKKIEASLVAEMEKAGEGSVLIKLWLANVSEKEIDDALQQALGYSVLNKAQIEKDIEERVGKEKAHEPLSAEDAKKAGLTAEEGAEYPDMLSPAQRAVRAKTEVFEQFKRSTARRLNIEKKDMFIFRHVPVGRAVLDVSVNITLQATKAEIEKYAKISEVESISFYNENEPNPEAE